LYSKKYTLPGIIIAARPTASLVWLLYIIILRQAEETFLYLIIISVLMIQLSDCHDTDYDKISDTKRLQTFSSAANSVR
jgi:hypothetical protein